VNDGSHVARPRFSAGTALQDTAHLTGGKSPTGTITFRLYGSDDSKCSGSPVHTSSATVKGEGYYTSGQYTPVVVGTYRWVAKYSGDDNNHGAATECDDATETAVIDKAGPDLSSSASGTPTVDGPRSARAGEAIHDTATLANGLSPTGSITFLLYGPDDAHCTPGGEDLQVRGDRRRQRRVHLRGLHAGGGWHVPLGRVLLGRRQQPPGRPHGLRHRL